MGEADKHKSQLIYQVIYVSTATKSISDLELNQIESTAQSNNASKQVTGILLYRKGYFMQVLEGGRDTVLTLLKVITKDQRHNSIDVVRHRYLARRHFTGWHMRLATTEEVLDTQGVVFDKLFENQNEREGSFEQEAETWLVVRAFGSDQREYLFP